MKALFCPVWYTMGKVVYREEYCFRHGLVGDSTRTSETIFWATQREPFFCFFNRKVHIWGQVLGLMESPYVAQFLTK